MPRVPVDRAPSAYLAHDKLGRNAALPDAESMVRLATRTNAILGRRFKRLWSKNGPGQTSYMAAGSATTWRGVFHTSPNVRSVRVQVIHQCAGVNPALGTDHYYQFTVGGVAQRRRNVGTDGYDQSTASFLDHLRYDTGTFYDGAGNQLAGNTQYEFSLTVNDGCRIVGVTIYECRALSLDTDTQTAVRYDTMAVGTPVLASHLEDLHNGAWLAWQKQGPVHVAWSTEDTGPPVRTGATYENVIDGATTGYAATAAGQWAYMDGHGSFSSATVPCVFWCHANTDVGATGRVRFIGSGGVLATITGIGTTAQIYTVTATVAAIDTLVVIEHSNATGGQSITTRAAGFYELGT